MPRAGGETVQVQSVVHIVRQRLCPVQYCCLGFQMISLLKGHEKLQRCTDFQFIENVTTVVIYFFFIFPLQMSSSGSVTSSRACCENGRPIMTDPHTGQTICSCQYGTALLNYSRVQGLPESVYGTSAAAYAAASAAQGYVPIGTEGSAFYAPLVSLNHYSHLPCLR